MKFHIIRLTENELKIANEKGSKYWIYLIDFFNNGKPTIFKINDPIKKLEWSKAI